MYYYKLSRHYLFVVPKCKLRMIRYNVVSLLRFMFVINCSFFTVGYTAILLHLREVVVPLAQCRETGALGFQRCLQL